MLDGAAAKHDLRLIVEIAQQLTLPAGPYAGADRLDIRDRQHQQQLQPLHGLHHVGESLDGRGVGKIAALRRVRHQQMMFHQPGHRFGLGRVEPEPRPELARDRGTRIANGPPAGPWRCRAGTSPT